MMPCDWIGIVMTRRDTCLRMSMNGKMNVSPAHVARPAQPEEHAHLVLHHAHGHGPQHRD